MTLSVGEILGKDCEASLLGQTWCRPTNRSLASSKIASFLPANPECGITYRIAELQSWKEVQNIQKDVSSALARNQEKIVFDGQAWDSATLGKKKRFICVITLWNQMVLWSLVLRLRDFPLWSLRCVSLKHFFEVSRSSHVLCIHVDVALLYRLAKRSHYVSLYHNKMPLSF